MIREFNGSTPIYTCSTGKYTTRTGFPIAVVDDLELSDVLVGEEIPAGIPPPLITALLSGPVLGTRIFGGRPPRSRRQSVPWISIIDVGVVIKLAITGETTDPHLDRAMGT